MLFRLCQFLLVKILQIIKREFSFWFTAWQPYLHFGFCFKHRIKADVARRVYFHNVPTKIDLNDQRRDGCDCGNTQPTSNQGCQKNEDESNQNGYRGKHTISSLLAFSFIARTDKWAFFILHSLFCHHWNDGIPCDAKVFVFLRRHWATYLIVAHLGIGSWPVKRFLCESKSYWKIIFSVLKDVYRQL